MVKAIDGGAVELYHNNSGRLATTAAGVDVIGTVTSDGADLDGAVVINESGNAVNFRVESAPSAYAFFLDATNSRVGINQSAPTESLDVTGNARLVSDDATSAAEPVLTLYRNSATPADGDYLGQIKFQGESDTGATRVYAKITAKTSDVTNLAEDGLIETSVRKAGSNTIVARQTHDCLKLINGTGLEVAGDATITGGIGDSSGSLGSSGQVLSSTGVGTDWIANPASGIKVQVANPSTASQVDFTPQIPDGIYLMHYWLESSIDGNIGIITSDDNGTNFNNGSTDWSYRGEDMSSTGTTTPYSGSAAAFGLLDLNGSDGGGAVEPKSGVASIRRMDLVSANWVIVDTTYQGTVGGNLHIGRVNSLTAAHSDGIDRIRVFHPLGGTITGRIVLVEYPIS